ncbi:MAG: serine hydrolase [Candidatus Thorarchaeota archaeon]
MNGNHFEQLENLIANLMQGTRIPSIAILVMKDGKEIYSKAIGSRSLEGNVPATIKTIYGIGSVTKSFTCLALLQLAEQGKLNIKDPIDKYLDFKLQKTTNKITIHHLMSHSSGIANLGAATVLIARKSNLKETYVPMSTFDDFLLHVNNAKTEIIAEPGERYFYLNSGYILLGKLIEKVSGMKFEDYIKQNILIPLNMQTACFTESDYEQIEDRMTAYYSEKEELRAVKHPFDELIYAAGGLICSVNDLRNYIQMYLDKGKFNGKQFMKSEDITKMFNPYVTVPPLFFGKQGYGYGWMETKDFFGETMIQHGGSTAVSSAYISLIPEKNIGVIIMGNSGNSQGALLSQAILAILLGKNPFNEHPVLLLEQKLKLFPGSYQTYKGLYKIEIEKKGPILYLIDKENDIKNPLIPNNNEPNDFTFFVPQGNYNFQVEFLVDKSSNKITLLYERNAFHKIN